MNNLFGKKNFHLLLGFVFLLTSSLQVSAQLRHELSFYGEGGLAMYGFLPFVKEVSSTGYCGDAGVGFTGFISEQWGIHTGVGFGWYNINTKINRFSFITYDNQYFDELYVNQNGVDLDYDLSTTLFDYRDKQNPFFVSIPLMLQFQTKHEQNRNWRKGNKAAFYAMAGVKALLLFNNQYESSISSLNYVAYFPLADNSAGTQTFAELGNFDGAGANGDFGFGLQLMFAAETGVKWRIGKSLFLYTGIFFDCALNDPIKENRQHYSLFSTPKYVNELKILGLTDKTMLMFTGVKLRLAFSPIRERTIMDCPVR